ncbi:MAG: choice-of-anchor J domain-containing protein [Chitinophagales bacterium]|nr:choice-of-anchor J domain-containing protein [Chitinophagales bacterium]
MKKHVLTALAFMAAFYAGAQTTIFSQDFSTGIPATWTILNNDGLTPASNVNFVTNAWVWENNQHASGEFAISTSWYTPAGQSDDWMITERIVIPAGSTNVQLSWAATAFSGNYPDGYEVKLSPTGGDTVTDFTVSVFSIANENVGWTTRVFDLTPYAGDTITIAFHNNSNDDILLGIDDIKIQSNVPNYNLSHITFDSYIYMRPNENNQFTGDIRNLGFNTVTSFKLNYSVNGGAVVSSAIQGVSIKPLGYYHYEFPNPFSPSALGGQNVRMWTSDINGSNPDSDAGNDSLSRLIQVISNNAYKRPVFEEFTGAWCGYCPDGHLKLEEAKTDMPDLIPVSIHDYNGGSAADDRMTCAEGLTRSAAYAIGFPSGILDAVYYLDEADVAFDRIATAYTDNIWLDKVNIRLPMATPANVSLINTTYDTTTRQIGVTVSADFLSNVTGDYRLNVYVLEDSVKGSGSGWDQVNYFSDNSNGGSSWSGSPYTVLDDPIVGWAHNHVLRKALGGAWGTDNIIPDTVASGSNYTKTYSYKLPVTYKQNYISLVGIVEEYNADYKYRNILNGAEMDLIEKVTTGIAPVKESFENVSVYPNPASNVLRIAFDVKATTNVDAFVTNVLGEKIADIYSDTVSGGNHTLSWNTTDVANGIYFVTLKTATSQITKRFIVGK